MKSVVKVMRCSNCKVVERKVVKSSITCSIIQHRDKGKTVEEETESRAGPPPGPSMAVWATTGSKVAPQDPQQVKYIPN